MSEDAPKRKSWSLRKRLEYIDFRLFWDARFSRSELADEFTMSSQQASADIAEYQKVAPDNLIYDTTQRTYVRAPTYRSIYASDNSDRHLLQLVAIHQGWMDEDDTWFVHKPTVEVVALRRTPTAGEHLMAVQDAIRDHQEIEIDYRSMTGTPQSWRRIAPHAIVYSAGHWYVRGWSRERNDFRDFNLNRIRNVRGGVPCDVDFSLDYEWHHQIDLILKPNPRLPREKQLAKEEELRMVDGQLALPVRLSLSFYLIVENNLDLDPDSAIPERLPLILDNREEVEAARTLARKMANQALARAGFGS